MPFYVNLVFQGGGVRGIAYAGVLANMPASVKIKAVAGTSAGSIVAALLAIGKTPNEIKSILEKPELRNLLEKAEVERMQRFERALKALGNIVKVGKDGSFKISRWKALRFYLSHHNQLGMDIHEVWREKGLHSSRNLRSFLKEIFGDKRFTKDDLVTADLRIVASDVSLQKYKIYSLDKTPNEKILDAVHASCSIPIFFQPYLDGPVAEDQDHFVDGGMLSNFPSFLFAQDFYPTIGFRLIDFNPPEKINSTASYLKALVLTMTAAHDKERGHPPNFAYYDIPALVPSTKFALDDGDVRNLYGLGKAIKVEWEKHSSSTKVQSYYDPKPHEVLKLGLGEAQRLFEEYSDHLVDGLRQTTTFSVYIEKDWSTRYMIRNTYEVKGNKQLILTRFRGTGNSASDTGPTSLADFQLTAQERLADGTKRDLIRIPAYNGEKRKGFLLFFSPPMSEGPARTTLTEWRITKEFANTLGKDGEDSVSYSGSRRATSHSIDLTFEIFLLIGLPPLTFEEPPGYSLVKDGIVLDPVSHETYQRYSVIQRNITVHPFHFEVVLRPASL